jgi:predicted dinucleotide-utilizing enzyme
MFGALDLSPKHQIARLVEIGNRAIKLAGKAEIARTIIDRPIACKVLAIGAIACAGLRNHCHLMRIEGERCLAALAEIIFKIDALPAIRAPELSHEGIRRKRSWLFVERS